MLWSLADTLWPLHRWRAEGLWDTILEALRVHLVRLGQLDWDLWCIDGMNIWAHRCAAGKKGGGAGATRHGMGRSRGGYDTKIHLVWRKARLGLVDDDQPWAEPRHVPPIHP